jgi:hypothetical protein
MSNMRRIEKNHIILMEDDDPRDDCPSCDAIYLLEGYGYLGDLLTEFREINVKYTPVTKQKRYTSYTRTQFKDWLVKAKKFKQLQFEQY